MARDAVDWLFATDRGAHALQRWERVERYKVAKAKCALDNQLDSPCPRWIMNVLLCKTMTYRQRIKVVFKHHKDVTGQSIRTNLLKENVNDYREK